MPKPGLPIMPRIRSRLLTGRPLRWPALTGTRPGARWRRGSSPRNRTPAGGPQVGSGHAGELFDPFRRVGRNGLPQPLEPHRVSFDIRVIDHSVLNHEVDEPVQHSHIGAGFRGEVNVGLAGRRRLTDVDGDKFGWIGPSAPVEDAHPQYGVSLGHVVADMQDAVRLVDVVVGSRLPIRPEGLFQGGGGGRRTQAGVAVHVRRAETRFPDDPERTLLLQHELA